MSGRADSLRRLARVVGTAVVLEGALVLAGWAFDVSALKSVLPGLATMKPNTAVAFVLAGFFLRQETAWSGAAAARRAARLCALFVALLGLLSLLEHLLAVDLGIDRILFQESVLADKSPQAGRMAPATASSLLLLGIAMWLSGTKGRWHRASVPLAVAVAMTSLVALIGYVYGVPFLYRVSGFSSMGLHTALTLLSLSFGLLASHPERGLVAVIFSDGPGGRAARQLLPAAAVLPVVLGWLRLLGQRADLYDTAFGLSLMVLSLIAIFSAVILWNAGSLDRLEAERRTAEQATREKSRILQLILDRMSDGVVVADADGRFLMFNRAAEDILGRGAANLAPERWSEHYGVFAADGTTPYPAAELPLARAIRGEEVNGAELVVRHPLRPESVWLSVSARPLQDPEGMLKGGMALFSDVTERRRFEEARRRAHELEEARRGAQEANRLKSEFLANMSHELRTPLNAVIGFAELLHDAKVGPVNANQKDFLGDILASSRHLLRLINDVLDLSKVEAGRMEFHPEPVDMPRLVGEIRDVLRSLAASKRISVAVEAAPGIGEIVLDPAKLKQVLYNYLSNALKFTGEGGRVVIRVRPEDEERFRLEVMDTGIGIRPEDLGRLFLQFQQLDAGTAKEYPGTGLGLALTKRIVEAQGGYVGARSVRGEGSLFFAVLPRSVAAPVDARAVVKPPNVAAPRPAAPTVLVVEDDPKDRDWLAATLEEAGYHVETVASGGKAIERCRTQAFHAIALDLLLPDMTGWDVLRALRHGGPNSDTCVIIVTVVAQKMGAEFQVHEVLVKPLEAASLLRSLERGCVGPQLSRPIAAPTAARKAEA